MKKIAICIDDFGMDRSINRAAFRLIEKRRVSGISVMTDKKLLHSDVRDLKSQRQHVDIGLHLNLTELTCRKIHPIKLLLRVIAIPKERALVKSLFRKQLGEFLDRFGTIPDYIDSHHHMHCFPIVRNILIEVLKVNLGIKFPPIRHLNVSDYGNQRGLKSRVLTYLSKHNNTELLARRLNDGFNGIYDFESIDYFKYNFKRWLENSHDGDLFMCHPAYYFSSEVEHCVARVFEFQYLNSLEVGSLLKERSVCLVKPTLLCSNLTQKYHRNKWSAAK